MGSSLSSTINNRNAVLLTILVAIIGVGLTMWQWTWWDGLISNNGNAYHKALKFDESNANQFPYAIKTQQGALYARGEITSAGDLLKDDNIDGEWLAIKKVFEEYRSHVVTYSCGYKNKSICTRTVWEWEHDYDEEKVVDKIKLLNQDLKSDMFEWKQYQEQELKPSKHTRGLFFDNKKYIKVNGSHRYYYEVVANNAPYQGGFVSDDKGIRFASDIRPPSQMWTWLRLATTIIMIIGLCVSVKCLFTNMYEDNDVYIN